jgi:transposase
MNVRYIVELTDAEREGLVDFTRSGKKGARKVLRAHILLMADRRKHTDEQIAAALSVGTSTVYRTKQRFVEGNVEHALNEAPRRGGERKLDAKQEALLIATACTKPPEGRAKWTLQLLADRFIELSDVESISPETVRRRLNENELKPWQKRMWCIPTFDVDYVANMEDVLDLYAEPIDEHRPTVCFDETPSQLIGEAREPIPATPGNTERVDCEYVRNGTVNLFMFVCPLSGWRHVKVTATKGNIDFAECMRDLVDVHFSAAPIIDVVLDNLNTHRPGTLYRAFAAEEARRILKRIRFHYTPKHGSWLNMAEIEIGILRRQCLDRRIPTASLLSSEVAAWEKARNTERITIDWMFDVVAARQKLKRAYAKPEDASVAADGAQSAGIANDGTVTNTEPQPVESPVGDY